MKLNEARHNYQYNEITWCSIKLYTQQTWSFRSNRDTWCTSQVLQKDLPKHNKQTLWNMVLQVLSCDSQWTFHCWRFLHLIVAHWESDLGKNSAAIRECSFCTYRVQLYLKMLILKSERFGKFSVKLFFKFLFHYVSKRFVAWCIILLFTISKLAK